MNKLLGALKDAQQFKQLIDGVENENYFINVMNSIDNAIEEIENEPLPIGTKVKVMKLIDDTADRSLLGLEGVVIGYNENGATGNVKGDPLYQISFGRVESFWKEELLITRS